MFGKSVPSRQEVNLEILSAVEDLFRCCIPHVICVLNPVSLLSCHFAAKNYHSSFFQADTHMQMISSAV